MYSLYTFLLARRCPLLEFRRISQLQSICFHTDAQFLSPPRLPFRHTGIKIIKSFFKDPCELFIQHNILYHIEMKCTHIFGPPGWIRTCTWRILSSLPLPVGLQEDLTIENDERKFVLALLNPLQA